MDGFGVKSEPLECIELFKNYSLLKWLFGKTMSGEEVSYCEHNSKAPLETFPPMWSYSPPLFLLLPFLAPFIFLNSHLPVFVVSLHSRFHIWEKNWWYESFFITVISLNRMISSWNHFPEITDFVVLCGWIIRLYVCVHFLCPLTCFQSVTSVIYWLWLLQV